MRFKNRELQRECRLINQEFNLTEEENLRLRKQTTQAKGASEKLEKMVYGIKGPPSLNQTGNSVQFEKSGKKRVAKNM